MINIILIGGIDLKKDIDNFIVLKFTTLSGYDTLSIRLRRHLPAPLFEVNSPYMEHTKSYAVAVAQEVRFPPLF